MLPGEASFAAGERRGRGSHLHGLCWLKRLSDDARTRPHRGAFLFLRFLSCRLSGCRLSGCRLSGYRLSRRRLSGCRLSGGGTETVQGRSVRM
ncbi:pentapeptide repeat-containing protein [Brevibacterium marinum]|uniref:pentapeptide repeat-containing protein n=1 Tax=Brevibacterium marinum TaxID=418643 RepID=UPI003CC91641